MGVDSGGLPSIHRKAMSAMSSMLILAYSELFRVLFQTCARPLKIARRATPATTAGKQKRRPEKRVRLSAHAPISEEGKNYPSNAFASEWTHADE